MSQFNKTEKAGDRISQYGIYIYYSTVVAAALCIYLGSCGANAQARSTGQAQIPFVESASFNPAIPAPESIIGHPVAEKAVRYPALISYLQALAGASKRVTLTDYGRTHEGRTLYFLTITSPANHKRLDRIKTDNAKLSDPRKFRASEQANRVIDTLPAVAWLN